MRTNILLSTRNQNGFKLEELLESLQFELALKTMQVSNSPCLAISRTCERNRQIIELLSQAQKLQEKSMKEMEQTFARPSDPASPRVTPLPLDNIAIMLKAAKAGIGMVPGPLDDSAEKLALTFHVGNTPSRLTPFGERFFAWFFVKTY